MYLWPRLDQTRASKTVWCTFLKKTEDSGLVRKLSFTLLQYYHLPFPKFHYIVFNVHLCSFCLLMLKGSVYIKDILNEGVIQKVEETPGLDDFQCHFGNLIILCFTKRLKTLKKSYNSYVRFCTFSCEYFHSNIWKGSAVANKQRYGKVRSCP